MSPGDASARDLATLQGVWEQVAMEEDGVADPPDSHGTSGALTTFNGHHFSARTVDGQLLLEGTFTLDASVMPKAITWMDSMGADEGKRLPASYELEGDYFVFIAGNEGDPRPIVFRTVAGQTMRSFVRRG
jgi:uncharacterized protein (TIGR03067 family)